MTTQLRQSIQHETAVPGGRRVTLTFRVGDEPAIPADLLLPDTPGPAPAALLLHGYSSRREHMAEGVGLPLLARGVASLAIDLPLHGTRADPVEAQAARNPLALLRLWRQGQRECRLAVRYLAARREVDAGRIGVAGYSMGSFLALHTAAQDPSVRAVVLAAGGDLPAGTPFTALVRTVADPLRDVRRLDGRPLLMVHGRTDGTMRPEQAERLFAAAAEPKELRWFAAGHYLPPAAIAEAAAWLAERLGAGEPRRAAG